MAAGITKNIFLGFRINSQLCFSTTCVALEYRKDRRYRTLEDSLRNKTPKYDEPDRENYDRTKPTWFSLEQKEMYKKNRYKSRVLVRLPDYSFVDGRPVPVGGRMRTRLEMQKEWAEKIIRYSKEMDFAIERHAEMQKAAEEERKNLIESKLKPKGKALSNSNKIEEGASKESENIQVEVDAKEIKSEKVNSKTTKKKT